MVDVEQMPMVQIIKRMWYPRSLAGQSIAIDKISRNKVTHVFLGQNIQIKNKFK